MSRTGGFVPTVGSRFEIIDNDGTDAIAGTFAGFGQGTKFYLGGTAFTISNPGGDGNDVVLTSARLGNIIIGTQARTSSTRITKLSVSHFPRPSPTRSSDAAVPTRSTASAATTGSPAAAAT
jgi:hypothetical protein